MTHTPDRALAERKLVVDTADYWFQCARNGDYPLAERLLFMANAVNHLENALIEERRLSTPALDEKEIAARAYIANSKHLHTCALLLFSEHPLKRCDCGYSALDKLLSERDALEKENARLKNCLNADGLHDPELVKIAGKPVNIFDAAMSEPRTFDPSNPTPPKGNGGT